jgi:hypothetical protein
LLRAPGSLFTQTAAGTIENLYTIKLVNKTRRDLPITLKLLGATGDLQTLGNPALVVPAGKLKETSLLIAMPPAAVTATSMRVRVGVYSGEKKLQTVKTVFVGPRKGAVP